MEHLYVDRVEGTKAILVSQDGRGEREVDASDLPVGTGEGDWLHHDARRGEYRIDEAKKQTAKQDVQALMDQLS